MSLLSLVQNGHLAEFSFLDAIMCQCHLSFFLSFFFGGGVVRRSSGALCGNGLCLHFFGTTIAVPRLLGLTDFLATNVGPLVAFDWANWKHAKVLPVVTLLGNQENHAKLLNLNIYLVTYYSNRKHWAAFEQPPFGPLGPN